MRVVTADFERPTRLERASSIRSILGAVLVQERDRVVEARQPGRVAHAEGLRVVTKRQPTAESGRRCASPGASART